MIILVYNVGVALYFLIVKIASLFNSKAKKFVTGRHKIFDTIKSSIAGEKRKIIWFHAASLGEFEQGRPLIEAFNESFPSFAILLTFFSPSGYEVRKDYKGVDYVFYLPMDTRKNAKIFVEMVNPAFVLFIKYEFWYHYANRLFISNIPLISVSSIFNANQAYFKFYGKIYRLTLSKFSHFFVQDEESSNLLKTINIDKVTISGDTRFDRVMKVASSPQPLDLVADFKGQNRIMVIGSSWKEDLEVLLPFINQQHDIKFIIAPHEINENEINRITIGAQHPTLRYSLATEENIANARILIIDSVGLLSSLYRYGEIAFVGGAFGKGLHNILEAAVYGIPVIFGNENFEKFREARELIAEGGAFAAKNAEELSDLCWRLLRNTEALKIAGSKCRNYVEAHTGATEKVMDFVNTKIG